MRQFWTNLDPDLNFFTQKHDQFEQNVKNIFLYNYR